MLKIRNHLINNGFTVVPAIFTDEEIYNIIQVIDSQKGNDNSFAIRTFLNDYPQLISIIFNQKLKTLLASFCQPYQLVRAIYFDKPSHANWVVSWHQDLTINVNEKIETEGFCHWLKKGHYYSVQPPINYLKDMVTLRIHLDNCTAQNGALKVISNSHHEIQHIKELPNTFFDNPTICEVEKGGVLMMKPLIWHSSHRTENAQPRRVIHLEFCSLSLPNPLTYKELLSDGFIC